MDTFITFILLTATGIFVFGFGLIWAAGFLFVGPRAKQHATLAFYMRTAGSQLIIVAALGYAAAAFQWATLAAGIWAGVIAAMILCNVVAERRRCLLGLVSHAAATGVPISAVLKASRVDFPTPSSRRGESLLAGLGLGQSLGQAITHMFAFMSTDAQVALRCITDVKDLGKAIQRSLDPTDPLNKARRRLALTTLYLGTVLLNMTALVTFFSLKIAPVYVEMFTDFELTLPLSTRIAYIRLPAFAVAISPVIMGFILFIGLPWAVMQMLGVNFRSIPGLDRLNHRMNLAQLLAILGMDVSRGESITETLVRVSRDYPHPYFAKRVGAAAALTTGGVNWIDALAQQKLVRTSEAAVLRSAEQAGSLERALAALSEARRRRVVAATHRIMGIVTPLLLVIMACITGLFVVAGIEPVADIILGVAEETR